VSDRHREPLARKISKNVMMPFRRELCAMQKKYDRMVAALDRKDLVGVRVTACHLVLTWLQMEAAFLRFIERTPAEVGLGPGARRERLVLSESNNTVRALFRRALSETSSWVTSPGEMRILRAILCWLYERLGLCSVVGFPDLSAPHALPFNQPRTRSHRRATRTGVRKATGKP
jgi:hypothetical protein